MRRLNGREPIARLRPHPKAVREESQPRRTDCQRSAARHRLFSRQRTGCERRTWFAILSSKSACSGSNVALTRASSRSQNGQMRMSVGAITRTP
jgi:hypothetical protein